MEQSTENIGVALGRIPSGCSILTVEHQGRSTGVLVSWVQQAAFEPPTVTVAVKQGRPCVRLIEAAQCFMLNVIGENATPMFKHFGRGFSLDEDAFSGLAIQSTEYGPMLLDCIAHLGCRIREKVVAGDHDLYVAEVAAGHTVGVAKPYVHIRKNGLSY